MSRKAIIIALIAAMGIAIPAAAFFVGQPMGLNPNLGMSTGSGAGGVFPTPTPGTDSILWDAGGDAILWDAGGDRVLWGTP